MRSKLGSPILLTFIGILVFYGQGTTAQDEPTPQPTRSPMSGMGEMDFSTDEFAPLVQGIYEGGEVFFIHTEASDPDIAELLTNMMGHEVVTVVGLAAISGDLLGNVYVFTNGLSGTGPLGFQPDVFDSIPGDEDYSPLRAVNLVTWQENATPSQLNSVDEIMAAASEQELEIEQPGIVVNMPILVWPGGHR